MASGFIRLSYHITGNYIEYIMCLKTRSPIPVVTTKPMKVYKVVNAHKISKKRVTINSCIYYHEWKLGRLYSISTDEIQQNIIKNNLIKSEYLVTKGFHFYTKITDYYTTQIPGSNEFSAILEGSIPAGSNIWISKYGDEIVSDCFVPNRCYAFIARKPFLGIKRKPKQIYYKTE